MKYGRLILEKKEFVLVKRLVNLSGFSSDPSLKYSLHKLSEELLSAQVLDDADMPGDVVRLNSVVHVMADNGWSNTFQLVSPAKGDIRANKISILTPMGSAVLGYALGDTLSWVFPGGLRSVRIHSVKQSPGVALLH